jgi:hypothetical protein
MGFKDTINPLDSTTSFYDWYVKENDEIIAKLNQAEVASILAGDGITASNDINGVVTISMSGKFDGGISFNGPVYFNGSVPGLPNISVKIEEINATVGGYTFGTPVRVYYDIDTGTNLYEPAKASDPDQAEVLGIVSEITDEYAYVTMLGKITGDFTEVNERGIGLTAGWVYFLSPGSTGMVTDTEPFIAGQVSKPVLMGITGDEALVLHMRGNYLNPDAPGVCGAGSGDILILTSSDNLGSTLDYDLTLNRGMRRGDPVAVYRLIDLPGIPGLLSKQNVFDVSGRTVPAAKIIGSNNGAFADFLTFAISSENKGASLTSPAGGYRTTDNIRAFENDSLNFIGILEEISTDGLVYYYKIKTSGSTKAVPSSIGIPPTATLARYVFLNNQFDTTTSLGSVNSTANIPDITVKDSDILNTPEVYTFLIGTVVGDSIVLSPKNLSSAISFALPRSSSSSNTFANYQYLINGNFNVWQRDTGKGLTYDLTGNVAFADMWKRHDGVTGSDSTKDYYIIRREFDEYQNQIEGSPEYYIDVKALGVSAIGYTLPGTSYDAYDHLMIGHVVPDAKRFDNTFLNVKFYAKCSHTDYTADAYFSRYSGTQLLDYINLGSLSLTTSWQSFSFSTAIPSLEDIGYSLDTDNDYCEIGIDLIPLMAAANDNSVGITQNVYVSIASFSATSGNSAVPNSIYPDYEEQLKYCQKFYFSSYGRDETLGSISMIDTVNPTQNTLSSFIMPNRACSIFKWFTEMRTSPTVTFYSPFTGVQGDAYNKTAGFDLRSTSGTIGYNSQIRSAPIGQPTIYGTTSKYGVNVCVQNGAVNYDEVFYHIIADADFEI